MYDAESATSSPSPPASSPAVISTASVVPQDSFDVPTTATFALGRLWAVNARFDTEPTPTTEYDVVQVALD